MKKLIKQFVLLNKNNRFNHRTYYQEEDYERRCVQKFSP